jgi:hypothetical protein
VSRPAAIPQTRAVSLRLREPLSWIVMALFVGFAVDKAPFTLAQDSWMCFVAGRDIVHHGLPHSDTLTVMAHGRTWVDQQWLAQTVLYGIVAAGGVALASTANIALEASALIAAMSFGRRNASPRSTALVGAAFGVMLVWSTVRAQTFAYPLFVAVVWLLLQDVHRPGRRVLWAWPLLILWANVHGSVVLGVAMVAARGVVLVANGMRWRGALLMAAPLSLVLTPYGTGMVGYYSTVLLHPPFAGVVGEWFPTSLATHPWFMVLSLVTVWLTAGSTSLSRFERALLIFLVVVGLQAERNVVWLGLAGPMLLPAELDRVLPVSHDVATDRIVQAVALLAALVIVVAGLRAATRPDGDLLTHYSPSALAAVQRATSSTSARVFASDAQSDWLLYGLPQLRGRVAYDVRFELLTRGQVRRILRFDTYSAQWREALRGYQVAVLSRAQDGKLVKPLMALGARMVYEDGQMVVLQLPHM